MSIKVPLSDYQKRQALKAKTGFDVDVAIKNIEAEKAEDNGTEDTKTAGTPSTSGRRATTNYKIVSKAENKAE